MNNRDDKLEIDDECGGNCSISTGVTSNRRNKRRRLNPNKYFDSLSNECHTPNEILLEDVKEIPTDSFFSDNEDGMDPEYEKLALLELIQTKLDDPKTKKGEYKRWEMRKKRVLNGNGTMNDNERDLYRTLMENKLATYRKQFDENAFKQEIIAARKVYQKRLSDPQF